MKENFQKKIPCAWGIKQRLGCGYFIHFQRNVGPSVNINPYHNHFTNRSHLFLFLFVWFLSIRKNTTGWIQIIEEEWRTTACDWWHSIFPQQAKEWQTILEVQLLLQTKVSDHCHFEWEKWRSQNGAWTLTRSSTKLRAIYGLNGVTF